MLEEVGGMFRGQGNFSDPFSHIGPCKTSILTNQPVSGDNGLVRRHEHTRSTAQPRVVSLLGIEVGVKPPCCHLPN